MTPPTRPSDRAAALEVALATPGPNAVLEQAPPPARPEAVATAVPEPKVIRVDPNATENKIEADLTPSRLALGVSGRPSARPKRFAQRVAALQRETPPTAAAVPAATPRATRTSRAPAIPSSASVARAATVKDVFPTRRLALVGVFGASGTREALLRTPSGRFVKVKTGDRVSGYRVSAIGSSAIRLRKGSRDTVLDIPN